MLSKSNGNTSYLRVVRGASLAHRQLNALQRGVIGANIADGLAIYQPTIQELARILKVSVAYIERARRVTPIQRQLAIAKLLKALPEPTPRNGNGSSDVVDAIYDDDRARKLPMRSGNGSRRYRAFQLDRTHR